MTDWVDSLAHIDPPLLDKDGNVVLDEDGFPEYNIRVIDVLNYLKMDKKIYSPIVLLKPLRIRLLGTYELLPIVDIDSTDSGDIILKVNTNVKIPTKE